MDNIIDKYVDPNGNEVYRIRYDKTNPSYVEISSSGIYINQNGTIVDPSNINIENDSVTFDKIQNLSTSGVLVGRGTFGSGDPEEITLGEGFRMFGTIIATSGHMIGFSKITVGTTQPSNPNVGDLWVDTN